MAKSVAFGVTHVVVAFTVGYLLTGDIAVAGALTLVEPAVNTLVHFGFDRWWGHPALRRAWFRWRPRVPSAAAAAGS